MRRRAEWQLTVDLREHNVALGDWDRWTGPPTIAYLDGHPMQIGGRVRGSNVLGWLLGRNADLSFAIGRHTIVVTKREHPLGPWSRNTVVVFVYELTLD